MYEKGRRFNAAYLARLYTLLLSRHVEMIHWFGVADWPGFESMGLMRDQNSPMGRYAVAPAYPAYANLIRQLTGVAFVKREPLSKFTYVYQFTRGAEEIRVCWATKPAHIAITTTTPMHVVDVMGEEQTLTPVNGAVCLTLTDYPYYVIGKASAVIEGGQFNIPAEQNIDLTDEYAISYAAAPGLSGQLNIQGKPYPVGAGKGGRAVLAGKDTHAVGSDLLWYTLSLNGKLNGIGGIVMNVVDPVSFRDALQAGDNTHVTVRLANESKRVGYTVNSITWKAGALTGIRLSTRPCRHRQA